MRVRTLTTAPTPPAARQMKKVFRAIAFTELALIASVSQWWRSSGIGSPLRGMTQSLASGRLGEGSRQGLARRRADRSVRRQSLRRLEGPSGRLGGGAEGAVRRQLRLAR